MRAWFLTYGEPPRVSDWNTSRANPEQSARFRRLYSRGHVPRASLVYARFGSWNAAIAAAGYRPRPPGGREDDRRYRRERCIHGHKMDDANVLIDYRGKRRCRTCQNAHQKRSRARRQARARGLIVD